LSGPSARTRKAFLFYSRFLVVGRWSLAVKTADERPTTDGHYENRFRH
jgi:hypothetical protein